MKRLLAIAVAAVMWTCPVFAAEYAWTENEPCLAIFPPGTITDGYYIEYGDIGKGDPLVEDVAESDKIRLLMINGGFVPQPGIVVQDGSTLVPLRVVSETLGAAVDWNGEDRTATVTDAGRAVVLTIDSTQATIDGAEVTLGVPAQIIGGSTYVPLRFVAEALEAEVDYIPSLALGDEDYKDLRENVSMVTIEKVEDGQVLSVETGLEAAKEESQKEYDMIVENLTNQGMPFNGDYDPQAVNYLNSDIGRYYVYSVEGYDWMRILYNKYTGEMHGEHAGLPFFFINEGFPNIAWLNQ